jgi:hypothetical protein
MQKSRFLMILIVGFVSSQQFRNINKLSYRDSSKRSNLTKIIRTTLISKIVLFQPTLLYKCAVLTVSIYADAAYGSTSPTTIKTLDPVHHKGVRLALGARPARLAIRVITNESHLIRSYFMNKKIHDEYAPNKEQSNQYSLEQLNTWVNYR